MKTFFVISLFLTSLSSHAACLTRGPLKVCTGDAVAATGIIGTLVGINQETGQVTISSSTTPERTYKTVDVGVITFQKGGCLMEFCVGDNAFNGNSSGRVVGVNSYTGNVSINHTPDRSYASISTYKTSELAIGKGCFLGLCVGDKAYYGSSDGEIAGLNLSNHQVVIDFGGNEDNPVMNALDPKEITVGEYSRQYGEIDSERFIKTREDFIKNFNK